MVSLVGKLESLRSLLRSLKNLTRAKNCLVRNILAPGDRHNDCFSAQPRRNSVFFKPLRAVSEDPPPHPPPPRSAKLAPYLRAGPDSGLARSAKAEPPIVWARSAKLQPPDWRVVARLSLSLSQIDSHTL